MAEIAVRDLTLKFSDCGYSSFSRFGRYLPKTTTQAVGIVTTHRARAGVRKR